MHMCVVCYVSVGVHVEYVVCVCVWDMCVSCGCMYARGVCMCTVCVWYVCVSMWLCTWGMLCVLKCGVCYVWGDVCACVSCVGVHVGYVACACLGVGFVVCVACGGMCGYVSVHMCCM